jgi:DNA polymerase III subunit gamma/tau
VTDSRTRSRGRRRFLGTLAVAALFSGFGAPSALAGTELPVNVPVVTPVAEQVTEVVSEVVPQSGTADTGQFPAVELPGTTAPAPLPAPLAETTADAVTAVREVTADVVGLATSASNGRVEAAEAALDVAAPVLNAAPAGRQPATAQADTRVALAVPDTRAAETVAPSAPTSTSTERRSLGPNPPQRTAAADAATSPPSRLAPPAVAPDAPFAAPARPAGPPISVADISSSSSDDSQAPTPRVPAEPFSGVLPTASGAAGSFAAVLAALAAFLIVAAPGLGRWLRPRLVFWPQPMLDLSLERPG